MLHCEQLSAASRPRKAEKAAKWHRTCTYNIAAHFATRFRCGKPEFFPRSGYFQSFSYIYGAKIEIEMFLRPHDPLWIVQSCWGLSREQWSDVKTLSSHLHNPFLELYGKI